MKEPTTKQAVVTKASVNATFACPHCGQSFATRDAMRQHIYEVHLK